MRGARWLATLALAWASVPCSPGVRAFIPAHGYRRQKGHIAPAEPQGKAAVGGEDRALLVASDPDDVGGCSSEEGRL
jgi:hypothetical protein